jgi:hypothetical protein
MINVSEEEQQDGRMSGGDSGTLRELIGLA